MPTRWRTTEGNTGCTAIARFTRIPRGQRPRACTQAPCREPGDPTSVCREESCRPCREVKKDAAAGVDGATWEHYGEALEANLQDLSHRRKRGAYRARPVRRVYIPKVGKPGELRPLGVPALEDKIVQRATVEVRNAIYAAAKPAAVLADERSARETRPVVPVAIPGEKDEIHLSREPEAGVSEMRDHGFDAIVRGGLGVSSLGPGGRQQQEQQRRVYRPEAQDRMISGFTPVYSAPRLRSEQAIRGGEEVNGETGAGLVCGPVAARYAPYSSPSPGRCSSPLLRSYR
jgi:hypothetical protein